MKHLLFLQIIFISLWGCSQEKSPSTNKINSNNFVEKVLAEVKHFPEEPEYWIGISKDAQLEIYLNDIPVFKDYSDSKYSVHRELNYLILKSGPQKIRYKLYSEKDKVYFKENIYYMLGNKPIDILEEDKYITMSENGVYEGEFTFNAEVPYENTGWSEGQDLTKFNQKELEKAVVDFYQNMWEIHNNADRKEELFPLIFIAAKENAISEYKNRESMNSDFKEYMFPFTNKTFTMQPLINYKMVLYGNGKIVELEQKSEDLLLKGESAFWAKYRDEDDVNIMYSIRILLYLPQGKTLEDGLQMIR